MLSYELCIPATTHGYVRLWSLGMCVVNSLSLTVYMCVYMCVDVCVVLTKFANTQQLVSVRH